MAQRKRHTAEFKAKVALEALREQKTSNQIASEYEVHATQISQWKRQALDHLAVAFSAGGVASVTREDEALTERLYSQIGQLKVELDWLKKKSASLR
jgi:transposase-like protein